MKLAIGTEYEFIVSGHIFVIGIVKDQTEQFIILEKADVTYNWTEEDTDLHNNQTYENYAIGIYQISSILEIHYEGEKCE